MPICSFCRRNYEFPRGLTIFTNDGRSIHYCSSKCRRNAKLGRDGRKINWVKRKKVKKKRKVVREKVTSLPAQKEKKEVKKEEKVETEKIEDEDED